MLDVTAARPATALAGRIMLAAIFLLSGCAKLIDHQGSLSHLVAKGVPWSGGLLIVAALVEIGGGLMVASGMVTRLGALALIGFLIPTTLIFHDFRSQVVAFGPGRFSIDKR